MVPDGSVDFVFSFDSLVHVEEDTIGAYIQQIRHKLTPDGVAFLHHSNIGSYSKTISALNCVPKFCYLRRIATRLTGLRICGRAASVTAQTVSRTCEEYGVPCISQELITWAQGRRMIDALSVFTRRESAWHRTNQVLPNPSFWREAKAIKEFSRLYTSPVHRPDGDEGDR